MIDLLNLLSEMRLGKEPDDREVMEALKQLRERFHEISHILLSEENKIPLRRIIVRGILIADEDLFLACEEHDSMRKEAYQAVRSMSIDELERASVEIIAKNLERTLLGGFIMRRID
ncbi:hypothetical protein [Candidatus Korarchaeum cryptofilum]|uniref:Uncharacterized protein n=1 Tax=Korarchaeum cryptofilum (strain OPF8) TaxID=374847 RepID=B1L626_KORCO|nr:hypothetical protein [Candidatus Korarchaeum cryptofilum]ACB07905.1 hypothetical protein Kcr_1159 [Candidatus Korarchaeum cryptofilum OPF8]